MVEPKFKLKDEVYVLTDTGRIVRCFIKQITTVETQARSGKTPIITRVVYDMDSFSGFCVETYTFEESRVFASPDELINNLKSTIAL